MDEVFFATLEQTLAEQRAKAKGETATQTLARLLREQPELLQGSGAAAKEEKVDKKEK